MLPFTLPIEPMLAKAAESVPRGAYLYEPKWDGFRAIVARDGDALELWSREKKPLLRYFPELAAPLLAALPARAVLDGELVIARDGRLDFEALQLRLHPAASRVERLAGEIPAAFVAFDLLAQGEEDLRRVAQGERRARLDRLLGGTAPPIHLTPATEDPVLAEDWFRRFEGAGLDGVIAKPLDGPYLEGKRAMVKIKHARTADCVVGAFRWHKNGPGTLVGSVVLGAFDEEGRLHQLGVSSSFKMAERAALAAELSPLIDREGHPWSGWSDGARHPGMGSRWSAGKDLSFEPLRVERVCEVKFDHLQSGRFRHAATFLRWRPDREPRSCTFAQFEETPPYEIERIFGRR